mgnify:CR=1 FL=1
MALIVAEITMIVDMTEEDMMTGTTIAADPLTEEAEEGGEVAKTEISIPEGVHHLLTTAEVDTGLAPDPDPTLLVVIKAFYKFLSDAVDLICGQRFPIQI